MSDYRYIVGRDTPPTVKLKRLELEIAGAGLTPTGTSLAGSLLTVSFAAPLTDAEKATLDQVVAAHNPNGYVTAEVLTSLTMVLGETAFLTGGAWQTVGYLRANPEVLGDSLDDMRGQLLGEYIADAQITVRILEHNPAGSLEVLPPTQFPAVVDWTEFDVKSGTPRPGRNTYEVQVMADALATDARLRGVTLSLLEYS